MLAGEISPLVRRRPFVPMRLHLADGNTFAFRRLHPVMVTRRWLRVATEANQETGIVDKSVDLWLGNILRIKDLP